MADKVTPSDTSGKQPLLSRLRIPGFLGAHMAKEVKQTPYTGKRRKEG